MRGAWLPYEDIVRLLARFSISNLSLKSSAVSVSCGGGMSVLSGGAGVEFGRQSRGDKCLYTLLNTMVAVPVGMRYIAKASCVITWEKRPRREVLKKWQYAKRLTTV